MLFARDGPYLMAHTFFVGWFFFKTYAFIGLSAEEEQYAEDGDYRSMLQASLFRATLCILLTGEPIQFMTYRFINRGLIVFNFVYKILLILIESTHFLLGVTSEQPVDSFTWDVNCLGLLIVSMHTVLDAQFSVVQLAAYHAQKKQNRLVRKYQGSRFI